MFPGVFQTGSVNTPSVVAVSSGAVTVLNANLNRRGWQIVNVDAAVVDVRLGGTASSTVYHIPLKACGSAGDGTGGVVGQTSGTVFTGLISVYCGGSGHVVVLEH